MSSKKNYRSGILIFRNTFTIGQYVSMRDLSQDQYQGFRCVETTIFRTVELNNIQW